MNRVVAVFLACAVIGAALGAWRFVIMGAPTAPETPVAESQTGIDLTGEDAGGAIAGEAVAAEAESLGAGPPARRVGHGTAAAPMAGKPPVTSPPSANEKAEKLARQVEKSLAGDTVELIGLTRLIRECSRGMASAEQVLRRLDRMAQFNAQFPGGAPGRADGGSVEYRSFDELESATWARFDECQGAQDVLNEDLHEQIARLADDGVPAARYLYAIWSPWQYVTDSVSALELLEYQTRALEYTWKNMQQRDPLGLLAMSQSYSAFRPSLFTPSNPVQGQVFLLAAMKCGIDNDWLSERSVDFGRGFSRFQAENTRMPTLDEDAAALAEAFCPRVPQED